jgi:hypothetical protein
VGTLEVWRRRFGNQRGLQLLKAPDKRRIVLNELDPMRSGPIDTGVVIVFFLGFVLEVVELLVMHAGSVTRHGVLDLVHQDFIDIGFVLVFDYFDEVGSAQSVPQIGERILAIVLQVAEALDVVDLPGKAVY